MKSNYSTTEFGDIFFDEEDNRYVKLIGGEDGVVIPLLNPETNNPLFYINSNLFIDNKDKRLFSISDIGEIYEPSNDEILDLYKGTKKRV